jgi:glycosyltransferase involved in cell wall biosynthesis
MTSLLKSNFDKLEKKHKISFIIVFLNEFKNLEFSFNQVQKLDQLLPDFDYEIIFVDDGSTDGSWEIVKEFAKEHSNVKAISFTRNFGAISAVMAGLKVAQGDYIVDMAADGQEPIELFVDLLKCNLENGYEISWGVRRTRNDSFFNKLFSNIYYRLIKTFAISNFPREGLDAFCMNRRVAKFIIQNYDSTSNLHNLTYWANFDYGKVYYDRLERTFGESKWSFTKKLNLFINSFVSFTYAPLRLVTIVGGVFFFVGVIWGSVIIYHSIFHGFEYAGYASLMALLLFGFGVTNLSLGIVSEYIWRAFEVNKKKPLYIIKETAKKKENAI